MDDAEYLTEADDTLEDDCTCPQECDHEYHLIDKVWKTLCDPACPMHSDNVEPLPGIVPNMTEEERRSQAEKFTWKPGDVTILKPNDPEYDDDDYVELDEQSAAEDRWHGKVDDIKVVSKPDPDYKGPTT